ncbi:hypothetical protein FRB95_001496 [Tulasnella sp. JGI-2019a]|nr:hypothetical protein FRB95_001496 [Tulasnella sp. JGI-2019a]
MDFHDQMIEKSDKTCILFVDGHNSHCTVPFLNFTADHNIIVISYPSHCTHALQGLDVACFGALKTYWTEEHEQLERETGRKVSKDNFLQTYYLAATHAFSRSTILSAFSATGVWPFKHGTITAEQLEPAIIISTHAIFLLALSTPVQLVMAAFHKSSTPHGQQRIPVLLCIPKEPSILTSISHDPTTLSKSPIPDMTPPAPGPLLDPTLFTPSKRLQHCVTILKKTMPTF